MTEAMLTSPDKVDFPHSVWFKQKNIDKKIDVLFFHDYTNVDDDILTSRIFLPDNIATKLNKTQLKHI